MGCFRAFISRCASECILTVTNGVIFYLLSSDNEEDRVSQNGRPAKSEFKDEEESVTPKSAQAPQATETSTTTITTARKRGGMPSKTVDLGAAAHYTGDKSSPDAGNTKVVSFSVQCPLKRNEICASYVCRDSHGDYICHI